MSYFENIYEQIKPHIKGLSSVFFATISGVLASFLFQIVSARALGPEEFGLLAAFYSIITVAAVASASVQNAIAVKTAEDLHGQENNQNKALSIKSKYPVSIIFLSGSLLVIVLLLSPLLALSLSSSIGLIVLAALGIPLSFFFAEALGRLQGIGKSASTVWWSSGALLIRVFLLWICVWLGFGIVAVVAAILFSTLFAAIGAFLQAKSISFSRSTLVNSRSLIIVFVSMTAAWLVNSDIFVLRVSTSDSIVGIYASAAILVKSAFILPSTMSLYLLPRFVSATKKGKSISFAYSLSIGITLFSSLLLVLFFWLLGPVFIPALLGKSYVEAIPILVPLTVAYLPWLLLQSVLIRVNSNPKGSIAIFLIVFTVIQWIAYSLTAPSITKLIVAVFITGVTALLVTVSLEKFGSKIFRTKLIEIPSQNP